LRKKASEKILAKKIWNYTIELKKTFVLRKRKIYLLLREKRREVHKFINEQLKKEYVQFLKLSQIILVFFVEKIDSKKYILQDYRYLNK